ncbi:hypothetical protein H9P43_004134 [Blastocladiella emersonii ATCC 22665]|nr:hypothetical protein H9P43_004134 [Blastocladiella emersonii ATCC 22665]
MSLAGRQPPPHGASDDAVVRHILKSVATRVVALRRTRAAATPAPPAPGPPTAATAPSSSTNPGPGAGMVIPPSAFAPSLPPASSSLAGTPRTPGTAASAAWSAAGLGVTPGTPYLNSNLAVTDTLAAFVVRAVVLNPNNGFHLDAVFARDDVDRLIEVCAHHIANDGDAVSETVKMQVYFDSTFPQQAEYLHREKQARKNTVAPILREITEWTAPVSSVVASHRGSVASGAVGSNAAALDALYRKIVGYVLLKTAMGNPTDALVAREAAVALESVFPQSEVATFLGLPRPDKEKQLNGLAQLVTGIRLFNRHVNKASKDKIENIPELCSREIKEAFSIIQEKIREVEAMIKAVTALLTPAFLDPLTNGSPSAADGTSSLSQYLASTLTFYRQLLIYLDAVREQIEASSAALRALDDRMAGCLQDLAAACKARSAVPVDQVYPKFMELAVVWQGFQDELFLDAFRRGVLDTVMGFEAAVRATGLVGAGPAAGAILGPLVDSTVQAAMAAGDPGHTDALSLHLTALLGSAPEPVRHAAKHTPVEVPPLPEDRIVAAAAALQSELTATARHATDLQGHGPHGDLEVIHPGNTAQYYRLPVEFGGFCPVSLVYPASVRGRVVPGDWNQGVVKYRDKLYAFRGVDEARRFAQAPEQILQEVLNIARERMGLVQLLQLYGYFPSIRALENAETFTRQALLGQRPLVCEAGTQVDTHMVDKHIDPNYQWNEWAMRRRALMLVNLRTKRTHGAQTNQSHFKRDTHAQVYAPRETETQTRREMATGMPKIEQEWPPEVLGIKVTRGPRTKTPRERDLVVEGNQAQQQKRGHDACVG